MKYAARLLLSLLVLLCIGSVTTTYAAAAKGTQSSQTKYVRLEEWGRANHFQVRFNTRLATVELSNRLARMVFTVDPRKDRSRMQLNGIQVALAFPIILRSGSPYIAQTDVTETLAPILTPKKNPAGVKIDTICIDPGHGGKDPGYRVGSTYEKRYTLLLAQELSAMLKQAGFQVVLTRNTDYFVERTTRTDVARRKKADLFVSLHFNAFPSSTAIKGVETYCLTPSGAYSSNSGGKGDTRWVAGNRNNERNMLLAYQIQKQLVRSLPVEDRGIKRARFDVLANASMPAVLVEGGFMSNPTEMRRIADPAYRKKMARAIADGIIAYKKAVNG